MITKRRPVRFPIRSRTTLGVPFGQHLALSTRRRQPLLAQKRSSNKPQLLCALKGGEYRKAAGAFAEAVIRSVELIARTSCLNGLGLHSMLFLPSPTRATATPPAKSGWKRPQPALLFRHEEF